ncbi:hypothetical protein BaRGS_00017728 [Batillaria attramentaria]|uniref:Uncharacterized protein n=1 Tax=Batillaria attramentaria TaxID=370345 RepID=A0ABD0KVB5_9CAEN
MFSKPATKLRSKRSCLFSTQICPLATQLPCIQSNVAFQLHASELSTSRIFCQALVGSQVSAGALADSANSKAPNMDCTINSESKQTQCAALLTVSKARNTSSRQTANYQQHPAMVQLVHGACT